MGIKLFLYGYFNLFVKMTSLPSHCATVCDFDLQAFDLLGEFDTLRVAQRFSLLKRIERSTLKKIESLYSVKRHHTLYLFVGVSHVQDFAHEVDD